VAIFLAFSPDIKNHTTAIENATIAHEIADIPMIFDITQPIKKNPANFVDQTPLMAMAIPTAVIMVVEAFKPVNSFAGSKLIAALTASVPKNTLKKIIRTPGRRLSTSQ
jgi:hypothetical protein